MEEKILKVLGEVNEEIISYEGENLFDEGILDSLQTVALVAALEDELDVEIDAKYVIEENFKTKNSIIALMEKIFNGN